MHRYRSHTCEALRTEDVGTNVRLSGWVHRVRDFGDLLFVDLRDHYGIVQVVVDRSSPAFETAGTLRAEWVATFDGEVRARSPETVNPKLATGEVEIRASGVEVLSTARELPLQVFGEPDYPEDVRLKHRFLDLRRETLHADIMKRTRIVSAMRRRMEAAGFTEFSTPILTASSPEGARDFLVPSRIHPGTFYALPQAPQQYKQLIMMSGFDRYFQIAPCFRDEDPRADRLPGEFHQLDVEMAFVEQEDVLATMEPVIRGIFEEFADGRPVTAAFPRIPYAEALRKYGTDKPDLRNPIEMSDVAEIFAGSGFGVFAGMIGQDPSVEIRAIPARTGGSRAFCDRMNAWAQSQGQVGLAWILWREEGDAVVGAGPVAKNLGPERTEAIRTLLGLGAGDACFFVAGPPKRTTAFSGLARTRVGEELGLVDKERFELAWIVDFPFFEEDAETGRVDFAHNPFSMPQGGMEALETLDPLTIRAFQYDVVCNGFEIASGGIRNQQPETMVRAFEIAGYSRADVEERFGALYRAFQYGAPPHGGMAAGVDRIVMLLCGVANLREVVMFPMNQQARDLLMNAPAEATPAQLRELGIRVAPNAAGRAPVR